MKRIAFIDYQLENYHANTYLELIRKPLASRGFEVSGCWSLDVQEGEVWAKKNQVLYRANLNDLNEQADYYMILAPSNPEVHWDLCQRILPFGKPTYVDKTFAPDLKTAEEIFALADRYRTPVQTSSALRYTNIQEYLRQGDQRQVRHMVSWGTGRSFAEYAIHPVELVVSCMGSQVETVMRRGDDRFSQLLLNFSDNRTAAVNVYINHQTPFSASVTTDQGTQYLSVDGGAIFQNLMSAVLELFAGGRVSIDRSESLAIRRILDASSNPLAQQEFIPI